MVRGYLSEELPREIARHERRQRKPKDWLSKVFVGVDGEGMDVWETLADGTKRNTGRHIYTYLCAADEHGEVLSERWADDGLTHDECMDVLLAIPKSTLKFGYMTSYDISKWIEQMPDEDKYRLLRPDTRRKRFCKSCSKSWSIEVKTCPHCGAEDSREQSDPVRYNGRAYDFFNGAFEVKGGWEHEDPMTGKSGRWGASTKIWDCIRFFGCSFHQAITDWKAGTPEQWARIKAMKDKRGSFSDEKPEEIRKYCQEECQLLAIMMRKVVEGHEEAGWKLTAFYGAGSTGKAMLVANDVKKFKGPRLTELHEDLRHAVMSSFFGGRFENSFVGTMKRPVWSKDIASAYPYAMVHLPCLACGSWRHVPMGPSLMTEISKAPLACVRFEVKPLPDKERHELAWAPLPFRDESGSICYPLHFQGWAWKPEVMQALLGWPHLVILHEAWVYDKRCDHEPFHFMPDVYRRRVAIGKEGPGLVLKLGANAGYGVTAQSIGDDPPFQQWIWAGIITSTCRAQALECMRVPKDRWSILTVATDGITATEDFHVPAPRETGTRGCKDPSGKVKEPLGGWETELIPEGMFVAKPGMYFRLDVDEKKLRARGIGRKELLQNKDRLIEAFNDWDRRNFKFSVQVNSRRFYGAKSTIYARSKCGKCKTSWAGVPERLCPSCNGVGSSFEAKRQTQVTDETRKDGGRRDVYGTWGERMIDIRFDPHPKRERVVHKGEWSKLYVRDVGGQSSLPYRGQKTPQVLDMLPEVEMLSEQPDVDSDLFLEDGEMPLDEAGV
jgi:rubrerythrin